MNSRERVLAAVEGVKPDYVPSDFHGTNIVLERMMKYFGAKSFKDIMNILGTDMLDIRGIIDPDWVGPFPKVQEIAPGITQDYLGFRMKKKETVYGIVEEHCDFIFSKVEDISEFEKFNWPKADWFDFSTFAQRLKEYDGYAIMASGASVFQHASLVRGIDMLLCDMLTFPEAANYLMDKYVDFYIEYFSRMFESAPGKIDILRIADDLGMQDRPLLSMELFMKYIKPRIVKLVDMAHSYGVKVMFHSCGSIDSFIEEIIDAGVDILDPIQTRATGMEPKGLVERFGGRICFHGSIDTQYTLPRGTADEIEREVIERFEVFGRSGGFIIAPSHTVQPDVPIENIVALYNSIKKYR